MAGKLDIKLINRGNEGELLLSGKLDAQTADDSQIYFDEVSERFDHLILNMAGLTYVSSAGLRVLKHIHLKMHHQGGMLSVKNVNENIMEVFEITGLAGMLNLI
ncbi:MAG: STAS domain-containing protein [Lachnospiraceae bacterium]|nr:STAS domain-containing protein [Lachnospiraceae bacterium]